MNIYIYPIMQAMLTASQTEWNKYIYIWIYIYIYTLYIYIHECMNRYIYIYTCVCAYIWVKCLRKGAPIVSWFFSSYPTIELEPTAALAVVVTETNRKRSFWGPFLWVWREIHTQVIFEDRTPSCWWRTRGVFKPKVWYVILLKKKMLPTIGDMERWLHPGWA